MNEEIINRILQFRDDRNWRQFHNPKDLAISISLEAAELLETFQWSGTDTQVEDKRENQKEELADIFMYCILMADSLSLDINEIISEKLKKNQNKYKVSQAYGSSKKYTEF